MSIIDKFRPAWAFTYGPDSDIVISTRARLARNLNGIAFPLKAKTSDLEYISSHLKNVVHNLSNKGLVFEELVISNLQKLEQVFLVDARVSSYDQIGLGKHSVLMLESAGKIAIMINEEDHLRIQVILPGMATDESWEIADYMDDLLSSSVTYAFNEAYGYLTASTGNMGTGLRISVMLHLGGLALMERADSVARASQILGISVRGVFGEGTKALGDLYQISNEISLGLPESEIVQRVTGVARHYINKEKESREYLYKNERRAIVALMQDTLEGIKCAETLSAETALHCISVLRIGVCGGIINGVKLSDLNELALYLRTGDPAMWYISKYAEQLSEGARWNMFCKKLRKAEIAT